MGYLACSSNASRFRFSGRGSAGEEKGSNAGRRVDAGFLVAGAGDAASSRSLGEAGMAWTISSPGSNRLLLESRSRRLPADVQRDPVAVVLLQECYEQYRTLTVIRHEE